MGLARKSDHPFPLPVIFHHHLRLPRLRQTLCHIDHDVQHLDEDDAAPELPVGDGQACELVEAHHLLAGAAFSYLGVTILREDRKEVYGTTKTADQK